MIPILLSNKVIKVLEGWLSSFIWSKRRLRLKMTKLQMAGCDGGLDVPNQFGMILNPLSQSVPW